MHISIPVILITLLVVLILIVLYYLSGRKKRRMPYYYKEEQQWEASKVETGLEVAFTVFLIGDAGAPALNATEPTLKLLQEQLVIADKKSIVFFLGDNIYPKGLPDENNPLRPIAEKRMIEQLKILKDFKGRPVFISGNHDWNKGREGGFDAMLRQQTFVDDYLKDNESYLPRNGCPGPVELSISDQLTIIVINSQWWVHNGKKPLGKKNNCTVDNEHEFFILLEEILERNKNKKILVIGHHPLYSKAYHGGRFDIKQHLFPLTEVNKKMYLPLPILGSIYPMYRKYIGAREDMSHYKYKKLRKKLIKMFRNHDDLIHAAGHDHNLQYIKKHNQHYIVSGAGCKTTFVQTGKGALFTHAHKGFFKLSYYTNGEVWLEVWEPEDKITSAGLVVYRKKIIDRKSVVLE